MSKPWSKLQREIYKFKAEGLRFQIQCRKYPMKSRWGSTDIPRYWITLNKEIIWDYPSDFLNRKHPERTDTNWYPHQTDVSEISSLIREYIDTPKSEILKKRFENDHWGLVNILRAADRRIGSRRLPELKKKTSNKAARKVLEARLETLKT